MRTFIALLIAGLLSARASAVELTITSAATHYSLGDTIDFTATGDSQGATEQWAAVLITFDQQKAEVASFTPGTLGAGWIDGWRPSGPGFAQAWNQVTPGEDESDVLAGSGSASLTLRARSVGVLRLQTDQGSFLFFGADPPVRSVLVVDPNQPHVIPIQAIFNP